MNLLLWGLTLGTLGKLMLGVAVLRVHIRLAEESDINFTVLKAIEREHLITFVSLLLIVAGYVFEVMFYSGSTTFFECIGAECASALDAAFIGN